MGPFLGHKTPPTRRLTPRNIGCTQAPQAVYDLLDEVLDRSPQTLMELHPTQAKLRVIFASENGQRPKSLTFEIKYPDRCSLKDDPHDQVCKKYLIEWGIAHA